MEKLATGLGWVAAAPVVSVVGPVEKHDRDALTDLGGVLAATLME